MNKKTLYGISFLTFYFVFVLLLSACSSGKSSGTKVTASENNSDTVVSTFAGGVPGADGTGAAVRFQGPQFAVFLNGSLYVSDCDNYTIRKIDCSTGNVTTIAGQAGVPGDIDGIGIAATFSQTKGIATDGTNLYVATNEVIRKIELSTLNVTTFSGKAGDYRIVDGSASVARFDDPYGIACDGVNLYVSEPWNYVIRKIVIATGEVSTIAGLNDVPGLVNGIGSAARFNFPQSIATDSMYLYVADYSNNAIRKVLLATGEVTTLAGGKRGSSDGLGSAAGFYYPQGIALHNNQLYVSDSNNQTIRKIDPSTGAVTTYAGKAGIEGVVDGIGSAARFSYPSGVASDGINLYVLESFTIRKIDVSTVSITTLAGASSSADGIGALARFDDPNGIASDGTNLYIADTWNYSIRKLNISSRNVTLLAGQVGVESFADGTGAAAGFYQPTGVTTDGIYLYVADSSNSTIRKIELSSGKVTTLAGLAGYPGFADGVGNAAQFKSPTGIVLVGKDLYVVDFYNYTIRKIDTVTGTVTTFAGSTGVNGSADGNRLAATFDGPWGITSDGTNLYVSEAWNNTIRKIEIVTGIVSTIAGTAGIKGSSDGNGSAASFNYPMGLTNDGLNLYVADSSNRTIRKIVIATGSVSTFAGKAETSGFTDGLLNEARFGHPTDLVLSGGYLYVTDDQNDNIRRIKM